MRFKKRLELEFGLKQIEIIPLIGLVFLLLIFFLLLSSFVFQPGVKINLPRLAISDSLSRDTIEIVISKENLTFIDGKIILTSAFENLTKQIAKRKQPILIKADRNASLGSVAEILDISRKSGVNQVNVVTN